MKSLQTTWATMPSDLGVNCDMAMGGISITLDRAEACAVQQSLPS
jgi:hypothetical protein